MSATSQADAFHYAGKVLDAAEAWHKGDEPSTWTALDGIPVSHIVMGLLTLSSLTLEVVQKHTGLPATVILRAARAEMLQGEHDDE